MTRPDPQEERLARLLDDAVSDVTPSDRLDAIRARTAPHGRPTLAGRKDSSMSTSSRRWWYTAGGAALATAAVVAAVALAGGNPLRSSDPGPAGASVTTSGVDPSASESPGSGDSAPPSPADTTAVAVYCLGETSAGPRLFREFRALPGSGDPATALAALAGDPLDPDYDTAWQPGDLVAVDVSADSIAVTVDASVVDRPAGMSEAAASLALQQVVYTLQAAAGTRLPVTFSTGSGSRADTVLGVDTSAPVANAGVLRTLALVNITTPEQGSAVAGTLEISGVANSFEATVPWEIQDASGAVVQQGFVTAEGSMGPRLFPFADTVDISGLAPGDYLLTASTDDPSGGAEGTGPQVDTKDFRVE